MNQERSWSRQLLVSDIHGCYKTFRYLVEKEWELTYDDELYILGDYIDRGPASKQVIDYILSLQNKGYTVHTLIGNHEDMLLEGQDDDLQFKNWLINGGDTTLSSFGVNHPDEFHEDYKQFFSELAYYYEMDKAFLVHAGFDFSEPNPFNAYKSMLWIRDFQVDTRQLKNKFLIHGHTPIACETIQKGIDRESTCINIDAGCVFNHIPGLGYLCGLNLNSFEAVFIQNKET